MVHDPKTNPPGGAQGAPQQQEPMKQQLMALGLEEQQADRAMALGGDRVREWLRKILPVLFEIISGEVNRGGGGAP